MKEVIDGIPVHRSWIFCGFSKHFLGHLVRYTSFMLSSALRGAFLKRHDIVLCESPPLFVGLSALVLKFVMRSKFVFNVSDLWPEALWRLGVLNNGIILKVAFWLEKLIYNSADLISAQTQGIVKDINQRFPNIPTVWLPNGVDFDQLTDVSDHKIWRRQLGFSEKHFVVVYAGLLSPAQGVEVVLHAAKALDRENDIRFLIIGDGMEWSRLDTLKREMQLANVQLLRGRPKAEAQSFVASCDASVVPLTDLEHHRNAIPSKIFDALPYGKPLLLGIKGEAYELFIEQGDAGLAFEPEDGADLAKKVIELRDNREIWNRLSVNGRRFAKTHFDREIIGAKFADRLKCLL